MSTHPLTPLLVLALTLLPGPAYPKGPEAAGRPRSDRYGDPLPPGAVARLGTGRFRFGCVGSGFALSPDGKTLLTADGAQIVFWELATGKKFHAVPLPVARVFFLTFSPDGKRFAAVGDRQGGINREFGGRQHHSVFIGETAGGKVLREIKDDTKGIRSVTLSPDGKLLLGHRGYMPPLIGHGPDALMVWDAKTGKELRHFAGVSCYALSPDGKTLAGDREDGTICLWDPATGRERARLRGHRVVGDLAFSPDGKTLASGGGEITRDRDKKTEHDNTVRIWDSAAGKELHHWTVPGEHVLSVRFSADGRALASVDSGNNLCLWDPATGRQRQRIAGGKEEMITFAFSPDGKTLIHGGEGGMLCERAALTGKELRRWRGEQQYVSCLVFSPDGKLLLSGGDFLCLWDLARGRELAPPDGHRRPVQTVTFSPDGKFVASVDERQVLRLWEAATGKPLPPFVGPRTVRVFHAGFSADGKTLAAVGTDATVHLWDIPTGRQVRQFSAGSIKTLPTEGVLHVSSLGTAHREQLRSESFQFSPDHSTLAVRTKGYEAVRLWDVHAGRERLRLQGHRGPFSLLGFSADGKLTVSEEESSLRLWDVQTGKERHRLQGKAAARGFHAFSPDGRVLAWGMGARIHLLDLEAGKELRQLLGHANATECVAFHRDGKYLVSGGKDQTLRLWDVTDGRELRKITGGEYEYRNIDLLAVPGGAVLAEVSMDAFNSEYSLRDVWTGREVCSRGGWSERGFTLSPDGRTVVLNRPSVTFVEVATGAKLGALAADQQPTATALAFSPDGRTLAVAGGDGTVVLWDWHRACAPAGPAAWNADAGERLWSDLASGDARKAHRALHTLAGAGEDAVTFLKGRLRSASEKEGHRVRRLVADLDHDEFAVREKAGKELVKLGAEVQPFLWCALAAEPALEVGRRVEAILADPALRHWSSGALRDIRAVQALEIIGSPSARRLLRSLAEGVPDSYLTLEAKGPSHD